MQIKTLFHQQSEKSCDPVLFINIKHWVIIYLFLLFEYLICVYQHFINNNIHVLCFNGSQKSEIETKEESRIDLRIEMNQNKSIYNADRQFIDFLPKPVNTKQQYEIVTQLRNKLGFIITINM